MEKAFSTLKVLFCFLGLFTSLTALGQHSSHEDTHEEDTHMEKYYKRKHKIAVIAGSSWVPEGRNPETEKKEFILAPTYGLMYEYRFSHKWAIVTHYELEVINILVEREDDLVKRENVQLLNLMGLWEPIPKLGIMAGVGFESDRHETLFVTVFGLEYTFIESHHWEVSVESSYVNKDIYDVISLGIILGWNFGKPLEHE
ncbi:hypothetical protein [Algivirga pacifica]|uniref:Outer membrane protein beta-barrel domain-containing protein n=1 Tax=Algivirga pacifica TaxID=1162670 RepID=A0ABP9DLD0_9BACT